MSTNVTSAEKRTDRTRTDWMDYTLDERDALRDRAHDAIGGAGIVGIDANGAFHLFSMTTRQIVVFSSIADTDPDTYNLLDAPIDDNPVSWAAHVAKQRGLWQDLRLSQQAADVLEADR